MISPSTLSNPDAPMLCIKITMKKIEDMTKVLPNEKVSNSVPRSYAAGRAEPSGVVVR